MNEAGRSSGTLRVPSPGAAGCCSRSSCSSSRPPERPPWRPAPRRPRTSRSPASPSTRRSCPTATCASPTRARSTSPASSTSSTGTSRPKGADGIKVTRRERAVELRPRGHRAVQAVGLRDRRHVERRVRDLRRRGPRRRRPCPAQLRGRRHRRATFSVRLHRRWAPPSAGTTPPSSTGSSSAPRPAVPSRPRERHRAPPAGRDPRPGARLGSRAAVGQRDHRAGRQRGDDRSIRCRRTRSSRAASCSRRRPSARRREQPGARLAAVLAEEKKLADEANRSRSWARVKVGLWGILGVGVPLVALVLVVVLYFRYGREPKTQFQAQYLRDIPRAAAAAGARRLHLAHGQRGQRRRHRHAARPRQPRGHRHRARRRAEGRASSAPRTRPRYKLTLHDERLEELLPYERQLVQVPLPRDGRRLRASCSASSRTIAKTHRAAFAKGYQHVDEQGRRRRASSAATSTRRPTAWRSPARPSASSPSSPPVRRPSSAASGGSSSASPSASC